MKNIIKKYPYMPLFAALFLAVICININVFPYGDDFFYASFTRRGAAHFFKMHAQHYMMANGRSLVHFFASLFLANDFTFMLWRFVNSLMLTGIAFLSWRLCINRKLGAASILCCAMLFLHIDMLRQSVYWLTGSMNYVYPVLMLLLFWNALRTPHKKVYKFLPVLAFFAAASVEQTGMMAFGLCTLVIIECIFIRKAKPDKIIIISLICAFAGLASVFCAPSVFLRARIQKPPVEGGIFALIRYNIEFQGKMFMLSVQTAPFNILSFCACAVYLLRCGIKDKKWSLPFAAASLTLAAAGVWIYFMVKYTLAGLPLARSSSAKLTLFLLIAVFTGSLLYTAFIYFKREKRIEPLFAIILGLGSQIMMLVSPVAGPRTQLCYIFMLVLFCCAVLLSCGKWGYMAAGAGLSLYFGIYAGAALSLLPLFITKKERVARAAALSPVILTAVICFASIFSGYLENRDVYEKNRRAIEKAAFEKQDEVVLLKQIQDDYGWVMPYHNSYYDGSFTNYYRLPHDIKITWVSPKP